MAGLHKWLSGLLGWALLGPIGAIIGFVLGAFSDEYRKAQEEAEERERFQRQQGQQRQQRRTLYTEEEQRNSFLVSLMVLSAAVIKADGRTQESELQYVRSFLRDNFGAQAVAPAMDILQVALDRDLGLNEVCREIGDNMNVSQRLQLLHYLCQIALADGTFSQTEKLLIESIGTAMGLGQADVASAIAMFFRSPYSAYEVLGIQPSATDAEVRSAYRRMAMKHHPDKVATLGPDVQKAAEEKFKQIQEAYETIKRDRNIV